MMGNGKYKQASRAISGVVPLTSWMRKDQREEKAGTKRMLSGKGRRTRSLSQTKNKAGFPVLESLGIKSIRFHVSA